MSKNDPPFAFFDTLEKMANPFKKPVQLPAKMGDNLPSGFLQDYQEASEFIYSYRGSPDTFNTYRREVEHFLHWCFIIVNKFLHHLQRSDRVNFLNWSIGVLEPGGVLEILDTDLEHYIVEQSEQTEFKNKLTIGYLKTLVEIEGDYTDTLKSDVQGAGFRIIHFDCRNYCDETDAFSQNQGDILSLKFKGLEIVAEKSA